MTSIQSEARPVAPVRSGPDGGTAPAVVAFLGTGRMGGPMAANLARGCFDVRVRNRTGSRAAAHGMVFADAPVSGSEGPARDGQLTILASGPDEVREVLTRVFGVLGRATVWLGPAGNGTRAKLVLNNWLADLTETTAESLSFARRLGLDPAEIVDLLASNPLGAPYAVQKARVMLSGDFSPAFALKHAIKDAELAAQANGTTLTLASALLPRWRDTAARGHADDDLAAVYLTA